MIFADILAVSKNGMIVHPDYDQSADYLHQESQMCTDEYACTVPDHWYRDLSDIVP